MILLTRLCPLSQFLFSSNSRRRCHISSFKEMEVPMALYFNDESYYLNNNPKPYSCFLNFVYTAILKCDAYAKYPFHSDLRIWLRAAVQRRIEHLDIELLVRLELPCCIFRTLVVLKLNRLCVNAFSSGTMPSVKTLHLRGVKFSEPRYLMELLYACPMLEDLQAKYIRFDHCSTVDEFKRLPKFVRADFFRILGFSFPLKAICNVQFLRLPELLQFNQVIPVFTNLTHLELVLDHHINWHFIFEMLKSCPRLQVFVLDKFEYFKGFTDEILPCLHFVPKCLSSHLRKCALTNYEGMDCELMFAKFVMQNSSVLQTLAICSLPSLNTEEKLEMLIELSLCPRSSMTCKLLFE